MDERDPSTGLAWQLRSARRDILAAAALLTRLPVEPPEAPQPDTARSYWAFGLVGLAVGAPSALLGAALVHAGAAPMAACAVVAAAIALLTGGMHHDGLADVADSLGGRDREHRCAIMRDSRIGSFGALALVATCVAAIASMAELASHGPAAMASGVVSAACMSRAMMSVQRWRHDPPSEEGLAHLTGRPSTVTMVVSVALGLAVAIVFSGAGAAFAILLAGLAVTLPLGLFLRCWIGGVNGDGLGATQQLSEAAMLMLLCAVAA